MKISEFIKELQKFKKEHGDVDVFAQDGIADFVYDDAFLRLEKLPFVNEDTGVISKRKYKTCVISQQE